jgi:predicted nucleic acid-binding protein
MAGRTGRPLAQVSAFWDSSALVPLCASQSTTRQAMDWKAKYEIVIWWGTPVEIAAALARLLRMDFLDARGWSEAGELAQRLAGMWSVVEPSPTLRARATEIVEHYDLRAADALQLAVALPWCNEMPSGHRFLTVDKRLRDAATLSGFDT